MTTPTDPIRSTIEALIGPVPYAGPSLVSYFRPRALRRGEVWLRAGDGCRTLGFLLSGSLRLYVSSEESTQTRWAFFENQFFTSLQSFQSGAPSTESIAAIEACTLLEIDRDAFWRLHEQHAFLRRYWQENMDRLAHCYEDRVNSLLLPGAEERYRYTLARYPDFVLRLPQKYVAEMLNMAPRHLSRVRRAVRG